METESDSVGAPDTGEISTVGTIADLMLTVDQVSTMDVSMYFSAAVSGSMVTVTGVGVGSATITVTATGAMNATEGAGKCDNWCRNAIG